MPETKAWAIIGLLGGLVAILVGLAILLVGAATSSTLNTYSTIFYILPILGYPELQAYILNLIAMISPTLAGFSLGPIANLLGLGGAFAAASLMSLVGIVEAVLGLLILIGGAMVWTGRTRGGGALMALMGFILLLIFNLGGVAGFIAGIAAMYEK